MKQRATLESMLQQLRTAGAYVLCIGHDDTCPGAHGQPDRCNCTPTQELVSAREIISEVEQRRQRTPRGRPR